MPSLAAIHMTKEEILAEIRRTAIANGNQPLGRLRFLTETGIREADWQGKYWVRWNDAVREAGYSPNNLTAALPGEDLLGKLSSLVRELGHVPVVAELKMKCRTDPTFPNFKTFQNRFGPKTRLVAALAAFAQERGDEELVSICAGYAARAKTPDAVASGEVEGEPAGYVYLLRHGSAKEFKIGRTINPIRREGEISIQLPQRLEPIHVIETDDPAGIEAYWHRRFADKRLKGEWFALSAKDVRAFRRWRKIF